MAVSWSRMPFQQQEVFQSKMYASCFQPLSYSVRLRSGPSMMPTLTGRFTVVLRPALSGWNPPNGTFMKRLLSTIHAEYSGAFSARSTSRRSRSVLSNPLGSVWGGRWLSRSSSARRTSARPRPPTRAMSASIVVMRSNFWIIDATSSRTLRLLQYRVPIELPVPDASFPQFGGNSFGQNLPPTSLILSLASWLFG